MREAGTAGEGQCLLSASDLSLVDIAISPIHAVEVIATMNVAIGSSARQINVLYGALLSFPADRERGACDTP
jgi:hypothetical protein